MKRLINSIYRENNRKWYRCFILSFLFISLMLSQLSCTFFKDFTECTTIDDCADTNHYCDNVGLCVPLDQLGHLPAPCKMILTPTANYQSDTLLIGGLLPLKAMDKGDPQSGLWFGIYYGLVFVNLLNSMISQDPVAFVGCSSNRHQLADSLKLLHRLKIDTLIVNREVNADSIRNSWPTLDPSLTLIYPQLMGAQTAERSSPNDFYLSWVDLPYEEVIGMLLKEITKVGNRQGFFLFHTTDRDVVKDEFTKQWEGKYMLSIDPNSIFANNLNERPFESIYEKYKDSIEAVAGDIFIIDFEGTLNEGQLKDLVEGFNRTSSQRVHIIAHQHNEVYLSRTLCRDETQCILWSISPSFDQTIGDDRLEWPNRVQDFEDFIAEPYRYTKIYLDMTMSENTSLFTITKLYGMSNYYHPTLTFTFDALILSWFASVAKGYGMDGILNSFDGTIVNDRAFSFGILRELANEIAISTNASNILNGASGPISFEDGFRTQPILARCIYNQAVLEQSIDLTQLSQSEDFQSFIQECNALVMQ